MLDLLPVELTLIILSHLPMQSIKNLALVCKKWSEYIQENQSSIYHAVSVVHGFIPSTKVALERLPSLYSQKSLAGVENWKSFCQRRVCIEKSWSGKGFSSLASYPAAGSLVHRIKVDEKAGLIITSLKRGGIIVTDLYKNEVLWSLQADYVKNYAHVEYGEGFLVFDCLEGSKEVWRLASDYPSQVPSTDPPQPHQMEASTGAFERHSSTYPRGHFKPWALLHMPRPTRAFRFIYPTLLVGSWDHAFLWDIESCELIQTINPIQRPERPLGDTSAHPPSPLLPLDNLNYVELSTRYVFVCGIMSLRIFSRATGKCVLDVPPLLQTYGSRKFSLKPTSGNEEGAVLVNHPIHKRNMGPYPQMQTHNTIDEFVAVHVSSCGRHLVAMLGSSRLVIIKNFEEDSSTLHSRMTQINLGSPRRSSKYLALDGDHIAVATATGLFLLKLSDFLDENFKVEDIAISRIPHFGHQGLLWRVTCLQLSDTGLYINWDHSELLSLMEPDSDVVLQDMEREFHSTLNDTSRLARLPTGDTIVLLDQDIPDIPMAPHESTVCGVDFVSIRSDV